MVQGKTQQTSMPNAARPPILVQLVMAILIWTGMIVFCYIFIFVETIPDRRQCLESIFSTPADQISFSSDSFPGVCNHGKIDFRASVSHGELALQQDRSFRLVDIDSGRLHKNREPWMKRCYFQPEDPYLPGLNGDIWVYTDDQLSRARVIGFCSAHAQIDTMRPEFVKIFDSPFEELNFGDYYRKDNKIYFHVYSPRVPFKLKEGCDFKVIDLASTNAAVTFPPRQKKAPWMTRCYHYLKPATKTEPAEDFWIFLDDKSIETFVIAQYQG
jgi:hypothetical protein